MCFWGGNDIQLYSFVFPKLKCNTTMMSICKSSQIFMHTYTSSMFMLIFAL